MLARTPALPDIPLIEVGRDFDVSRPWLNRVLEGAPRQLLRAVDAVSFDVARGETLALVGESGCGKTTVARLIVGLYALSRGRIELDGEDVREVQPDRAAVSYSEENTFDADVADRARIGAVIQDHAESVARRLRRDGLAARTLVLKVKLAQRKPGVAGTDWRSGWMCAASRTIQASSRACRSCARRPGRGTRSRPCMSSCTACEALLIQFQLSQPR